MKKTTLLLSGIIFFFSARAQSFEIGARYLAVSNWFFNQNVSNAGASDNYAAAYSYSYGAHIAYNFTDHTGLEADVMLGTNSQSYTGSFDNSGLLPDGGVYVAGESYKSTSTLNITQVPLFFRFLSGNGAYWELGPELSLVKNATYTATYKGGPTASSNYGTTQYFTGSYFSAVLGFGNNIRLYHTLFFNINLRFSYNFTDIKGVDGLGQNLDNNDLYSGNPPYYNSYKPTHAASAAFGLGLIYRIGHDF